MAVRNKILIVFVLGLFGLGDWAVMAQDDGEDPVLDFYRERAAGQTESRNPMTAGLTFDIALHSYRYKLHKSGREELTDSASFINYYSFGNLDSQTVAYSTNKDLLTPDLTYPNVFEGDYQFNFYPNDTGGEALAIGFESDSANTTLPLGMAVIDRTRYYLLRLYLYYPSSDKYERYSRELVFEDYEGYNVPDTIVTTFALAGIFSVDYYRTETTTDSISISR